MASTAKVSVSKTEKRPGDKAVASSVAKSTLPIPAVKKFTPKEKAPVATVEATDKAAGPTNGTYEFLVESFAKPVTIVDAAVLLAEHGKYPGDVAAKKVEAFLENAKIDSALEVRAGTGSNDGQYVIARVPQGAQHKGGMAVAKKGMPTKGAVNHQQTRKAADGTKKAGVIATMLQILSKKELTKADLIAEMANVFPDRKPESMAATFSVNFAGADPFQQRERGHKIHQTKKDGIIHYKVVIAKL